MSNGLRYSLIYLTFFISEFDSHFHGNMLMNSFFFDHVCFRMTEIRAA